MKTLIVYASTYGYTRDCAEKLKEQLSGEVCIANVDTDTIPSADAFDNIIIGGSIYIGQINKKLHQYCADNLNKIMEKRLALFLCCGLAENFEQSLKNAFPEAMINKAVAKECFGGELRIEKMKFFHKMLTGMMKKAQAKEGKPDAVQMPENIIKLAQIINK